MKSEGGVFVVVEIKLVRVRNTKIVVRVVWVVVVVRT